MRKRFCLAAIAAFFVFALWPTAAAGQWSSPAACSPRTDVVGHLAKKYGEAPIALGITSRGGLVEVLTTGDGSTWTIIVSMPNGNSCMVAAGESWQMLHMTDTRIDPRT